MSKPHSRPQVINAPHSLPAVDLDVQKKGLFGKDFLKQIPRLRLGDVVTLPERVRWEFGGKWVRPERRQEFSCTAPETVGALPPRHYGAEGSPRRRGQTNLGAMRVMLAVPSTGKILAGWRRTKARATWSRVAAPNALWEREKENGTLDFAANCVQSLLQSLHLHSRYRFPWQSPLPYLFGRIGGKKLSTSKGGPRHSSDAGAGER